MKCKDLEDFGIDTCNELTKYCNICDQTHYRIEYIDEVFSKIGSRNVALTHLSKKYSSLYKHFLKCHHSEYVAEFERLLVLL